MDPTTSAEAIIEAINHGNPLDAIDEREALIGWLSVGGFAPSNVNDLRLALVGLPGTRWKYLAEIVGELG